MELIANIPNLGFKSMNVDMICANGRVYDDENMVVITLNFSRSSQTFMSEPARRSSYDNYGYVKVGGGDVEFRFVIKESDGYLPKEDIGKIGRCLGSISEQKINELANDILNCYGNEETSINSTGIFYMNAHSFEECIAAIMGQYLKSELYAHGSPDYGEPDERYLSKFWRRDYIEVYMMETFTWH